jgi:hypothetical protein
MATDNEDRVELKPNGMELRPISNLTTDTSEFTPSTLGVEEMKSLKASISANSYAAKKSVAQGMMDIALLTANANQLRYLMEYGSESPTYSINLVLIVISLIIQVRIYLLLF